MTPAKGYTEMKESGIEWLGKIPNNWCTIRVKYALIILNVALFQKKIFKTWLRQGVSLNLGMYYWLKTEQQQAVWE